MEEEVIEQEPVETGDQNAQVEGGEVVVDEGAEVASPQPYTQEELLALLKGDGVIDRKRLTPEGQVLQKTFEKGLTPKFQEAAELRRQGEALMKQAQDALRQAQQASQAATSDPKEKYYQAYKQNPQTVTQELDDAIYQLRLAPDSEESRIAIAKLERTKSEYFTRYNRELTDARSQQDFVQQLQGMSQRAEAEIQREIPDLRERLPQLNEFAQQNGFTPEVLQVLTNAPALEVIFRQLGLNMSGVEAVKQFTKFVNSTYEATNPGKKQVKRTPKELGRAGAGGTGKAGSNLQNLMDQAKKTGDWSAYLQAKGAIKL